VGLLSNNTLTGKSDVASIMALIPARSGSKGVPHKNIKLLGGHPLIEWSIAACKSTVSIDTIVVSTDSEEYAQLSRKMGAEVPFLRPAQIAGDRSTDHDFIKHALDWFSQNGGEPEYIVHIRPTTPFRDPDLIDKAVSAFINHPQATALRSVHPMSESAYKTFEIAPDGQLKRVASESTELDVANNPRQQFPTTYIANGYVDVLASAFIRKTQLIHGNNVLPFITPVVTEVDTREDFFMLEMELQNHPEFARKLFK
jgi:CMP-N,N'-diacetyllegionaminic acid synthase